MKMDKEKIEIRNNSGSNYNAEAGIVEGYAAVFESESAPLGYGGDFKEIIKRSAITQDTINKSDVFATLDHDRQRGILARSRYGKGSLQLEVDEHGLKYKFTLANTQIANELRSYLERGEIDGSSFAFTVSKEEWVNTGDTYVRHIHEIDGIYDVSAVFSPAYAKTDVAMRSLDEIKKREIEVSIVNTKREQAQRRAKMARLRLKTR
jgi:HK97 family phage prohead protease